MCGEHLNLFQFLSVKKHERSICIVYLFSRSNQYQYSPKNNLLISNSGCCGKVKLFIVDTEVGDVQQIILKSWHNDVCSQQIESQNPLLVIIVILPIKL